MNINELDTYNLADAVKFHRRLNPRIWGRDEQLLPEVREKLLAIAADFQEFLGVEDLDVQDITISGSNAAYSYTKNSDIDLHLVVNMPADPVYQELFNAKKYQYNDEHNIKIGGADVELYVQPADQAHHSQGIYSIKDSEWRQIPQRKRAQVDDACVRDKTADLDSRIHAAVKSKNIETISTLWDKIKAMRKIGLEQHGEFGCENISFKMLRNSGCIRLLKDAMMAAQDRELSLREAPVKKFRYGFSEGMQSQPYSTSDGVAASTKQFLEDADNSNDIVQDFIQQVTTELGIDPVPEIHLHTDPEWSENNHSFGRYDPESHTLNVSMPNRHVMDVLRTVAHELVHCSQNQQHGQLPDDAGETGSRWENDANARAGIIMRDWANSHPEHFAHDSLEESASGYIPKNKKEAKMPQYAMALSVDIKPGQVGKEANKLGLKTGRNGEPSLLSPSAQNLLREFAEFTEEQDNLFEVSMSPSSLKKLSAQTGALAGMEFEMIVPNTEGNDDGDLEPDYEYDERCRSIDDAVQFFYDGDYNGRREVERLRDRMQNDFQEWLDDKLYREWERSGEEYLEEWVPNNVDESEWNSEGLEGDARQEALAEFIANMHADPGSSDAFDEFREELEYDESDWLDDEDLDRMSSIENTYSMSWPHWTSTSSGESSIEEVADSFQTAIGRDVQASSSYHSGRVERPSTKSLHYIVEPDGSLDPDDSNDQGLEFVSPPLPIEELLSDLNKVKAWADKTGCYTNSSTGLHINVSVPGWSGDLNQLDYVKLALLLGDEFVLDSFGRAGNTYAKSAMGKIRSTVKQNPDRAKELMDKMKSGMDQLASKVIHGRSTEKYTSINVKNGYIEFRSPGGDWLNDNFAEIDNTLRRFTVALSAAVNPEQYRQEYLKKLYKLLDVSGEKDPLSYFAKYSAGELPKAALKSFVRQAQLERGVNRGKETGPMVWRVYKEGKNARNGAVIEVVALNKEEALDKAAKEWGVFSDEYRRAMYAEPLRPYKEEPATPQQEPQGVDTRVDYELYDRTTNAVIDTFPARNDDEARVRLDDYRSWPGASNPDNFGVRRAGRNQPTDQLPVWYVSIIGRPGTEIQVRADNESDARREAMRMRLDIFGDESISNIRASTVGVRQAGTPTTEQYYDVTWTDGGSESMVRVRAPNANAAMDRIRSQSPNITDIEANLSRYQDAPGSTADLQRQRAAGASTTASHPEGRGRPHDPTGRYAIVARSDQAAYGRTGGPAPNYQFRFNMQLTVANRLQGLYVLQAWAARNNVNADDYMVVDTTQYADAAQGGTVDVATDRPAAPQPAGMGQWNGQWRVLVNGQEVYRFGGIGNSQADANRIAAQWLRDNGQGVSGEGFEVYPVMNESLTEYRMPQPSQGPGRYRDLNEPLGPEFPPTMPAGTVKVDVSDVYDWYKLGQHISNMKGLGQHDFGQGPPSAILSFGDEDLEHQYIQALKKTGLTTTDIDPVDPDQPPGMPRQKTDPTYNVDEDMTRRGFVRGVGAAAAGLAATGVGAKQLRDYEPQQISHITQIVNAPDAFAAETQQLLHDKYVYNRLTKDAFLKMKSLPDFDTVVELEQVFSKPMNSKVTLMFNHNDGRGYWLTPEVFDTIRKEMAADQLLAKNKRPGGVPMAKDPMATDRLPNTMRQSTPPTPGAEQDRAYRGIGANQPTESLDEDWRSALATGAMAGAMAMGAQAKAPDMVQQIVEPGDTIYSIARQTGADPKEIYRLNKMDRNTKLEIGQRVIVPDYSKPIKKLPATVTPTVKPQVAQAVTPAPSLKDKITSMIPKFSSDDKEEEGVTLLSDNTDAEAALQTAAKAAGLTGVELAQFMAQTRHESWDFGKMKEVGNKKQFAKYDAPRKAKQLGNKVKGDGERFKGRGFIQLTGRDNYTRASQQIFGDDRLVKNPDLASRLDVGAQIALWFWKNQVRPNVSNFNNTKEVTNAINPGLSGLQDRHTKFKEYLAVL